MPTFLLVLLYIIAGLVFLAVAVIVRGKIKQRKLWPHGGKLFYRPPRNLGEQFGLIVKMIREPAGDPQIEMCLEAQAKLGVDAMVAYQRTPGGIAALPTSPSDLYYLQLGAGAKHVRKPEIPYAELDKMFGAGNIVSERDVDRHRIVRKQLQPAFSAPAVRSMEASIFPPHVAKAVSAIREECAKAERGVATLNLGPRLDSLTLDVIAQAAFHNKDINAVSTGGGSSEDDKKENISISTVFADLIGSFGLSLSDLLPEWIQQKVSSKRKNVALGSLKLRNAAALMANQLEKKLKDGGELAVAGISNGDGNKSNDAAADAEGENVEGRAYTSLLEAMVREKQMCRDVVISNASVFLFAGAETTSTSILWGLYLLAKHPAAQKQLAEEVADVIGLGVTPTDPSDIATIQNLPYLNAFQSENMRIFPPVPTTLRVAAEDITCPASGTTIPKGCMIALSSYAVQHSKAIWGEDAAMFKPERWLPENAAKNPAAHRHAKDGMVTWMPFLHGSRNCLGSAFAWSEALLAIALLVRNFEFEWPEGNPEPQRKQRITMRPAKDMLLQVKVRKE